MAIGKILLNDGNEIPVIAFGTGSALKRQAVTEYVGQAIESGFSHIDTAQAYENEKSVGIALRESGLTRTDLYVTTKYFQGDVASTCRESLSKLGLEYVDLYLIHTPLATPDIAVAWSSFEKIKGEGPGKRDISNKRSVGVSNFNVQKLQELMKFANVKPAVNQIRFHPYNYAENKSLLEYSAKHGIITEAYGSLAPITKFPGGSVDAPIAAAAKRIGATPAQFIFSWVRSKGAVIVTTSSKKERLREYLAVADLPPLTKEEILAIDVAGALGPPATLIPFHPTRGSVALVVTLFCLLLVIPRAVIKN